MLETIRQYAQERLVDREDAEAVRSRHAQWCADFARAAGRGLYTPDERVWVERLRAEIDNLQVAVTWSAASGETELAVRLGGSFTRQAMARPFLGTAYLAEQAMHVVGFDEHALRARVMAEASWACLLRGDKEGAESLLERAIDAQRHGARYATAAYTYSLIELSWEWTERAYEIAKEGLERAEAVGDVLSVVGSRVSFAAQAMLMEREAEALEHAERALDEARALHQPTLEMAAVYVSGLAHSNADPPRAIDLLHEAVAMAVTLDNESERVSSLALLAALEARHGDAHRGLVALREQMVVRSVSAAGRSVSAGYLGIDLYIAIEVFNRLGRPDLAARSDGLFRQLQASQLHYSPPPLYRKYHEQAIDAARRTLGEEAFQRHVEEGAAVPADQVREAILHELDDLIADTA